MNDRVGAGQHYSLTEIISREQKCLQDTTKYTKSMIFHERVYKDIMYTMRKGDTHAQDNHE